MLGPGHLAIGFAVKPAVPKAPLWVLLAASEVLDLLWFGFMAAGIENLGVPQTDFSRGLKMLVPSSIPWSHGLLMSLIWSIIFGGIAFLIFRDRKTSGIIGLVVFSHWVLDFLVHIPDLPLLFASSPKVGLGMWGTGSGLLFSSILELMLLAGGIAMYRASKRKR